MTIVNATKFRNNMSHYFKLAQKERVIVTHKNDVSYELVPNTAIVDDGNYFSNPSVIANLEESTKQAEAGEVERMSSEEFGKRFGV